MTDFFRRQHEIINIAIFYILISFLGVFITFIKDVLNFGDIVFFDSPSVIKDGVPGLIVKSLIAAPLLETLIFQKFVYYLLLRIFYRSNRVIINCIVSGVLFGLSHFYSLYYIILTTLIGIVFMYVYLIYIKNLKKGFWIVVTIHFLINLSALMWDVFFLD